MTMDDAWFVLPCVVVCYSTLQCGVVHCSSALQCVTVRCSAVRCNAMSAYSSRHSVPAGGNVLMTQQHTAARTPRTTAMHYCNALQVLMTMRRAGFMFQHVAVCRSVLQCVAVCCRALQCLAVQCRHTTLVAVYLRWVECW